MKRMLALLCAVLLLCTGCVHSVRLSKRAVIQALGIDFRDGTYIATMQLYGLSGQGPQGAETVTAQGDTLTALFADGAVRQGKQLFLGNLRLIVFGSSLATEGVADALQFLNGYHQLSPATQVAVALGDASDLLQTEQSPSFSAGGLLEVLTSAQKSGLTPECRLMDFIPSNRRDRAVPVLLREKDTASDEKANQSGDAGESSQSGGASGSGGSSGDSSSGETAKKESGGAAPVGAVIFSGGRAVSYLTPEMAQGLCWLQGGIRAAVVETRSPRSAAVTHRISHSVTPEAVADNVVFDIRVDIGSTLLEAPEDQSAYPAIAREQERLITREIERFLAASCRQGYDPLDMKALLERLPGLPDKDPRELLAQAGYAVTVSCQVDRKGAAAPS